MEQKQRRKKIKNIIGASVFVLVTLLLGVLPMLASNDAGETGKASILSGTAQVQDMQRTLIGGGALSAVDEMDVTIPDGVKVTKLIAANGDVLKKGDPIAEVDKVSVMAAVTEVQKSLDNVAKQLKTVSAKITPGAITVDEEGNIYSAGKKVAKDKLTYYAQYLTLSKEHREYEDILLELFLMNQNGTINAPCDGLVDGLDQSIVSKLSNTGEVKLSLLAMNTPKGDDDLTYSGFVGVVNSVSDGMWNMLMNPTSYVIKDFAHPNVNVNLMGMTMTGIHKAETVMACTVTEEDSAPAPEPGEEGEEPGEGGETPEEPGKKEKVTWSTVGEIQSGDILLFTYCDGSPAWIIKLGKASVPGGGGNHGGIGGIDWSKIRGAISGRGGTTGTQEEEAFEKAENYLCTVVPQEKMILTVSIDEQDIAELKTGMTADVTIDALPNQKFTGTVTEVSKFGASNGGSSKFEVKLELAYSEGMLPGMNAGATLVLENVEKILTVPVSALVERGSQTLIYTGFDAKTETLLNPVEVETGLSDGENVQILSGLSEGAAFWYSYYDQLEISNAVENRRPFG